MAITAIVYGKFLLNQINGAAVVDFDTDTIKVSLHTATYAPNRDTHDFFDDATNEVANGSGYTTGGVTLASIVVALDTAGDFVYFDAADAQWTALTKTFRYAVIYKDTGAAGTSPLIAYIDFGADEVIVATNYALIWQAAAQGGIFKLAAA